MPMPNPVFLTLGPNVLCPVQYARSGSQSNVGPLSTHFNGPKKTLFIAKTFFFSILWHRNGNFKKERPKFCQSVLNVMKAAWVTKTNLTNKWPTWILILMFKNIPRIHNPLLTLECATWKEFVNMYSGSDIKKILKFRGTLGII